MSRADPNSDMETSSAQCTLVIGVVELVEFVVGVDVERALSRAQNKSHE